MIGTLLLIFGLAQIVGALSSSWIILTGLTALIMPLIVTTIDVDDHLREGRGLFGHKAHCWMESKTGRHAHSIAHTPLVTEKENWRSR